MEPKIKLKVTMVSFGQLQGVQIIISCDLAEPKELDRKAEVESQLALLGFTSRLPPPKTAPCVQPGRVPLYLEYSAPETLVNADDIKTNMKAALESLRDWAKARGYETEFPDLGSA